MTIYLTDAAFLDVAISYSSLDRAARLVLLQDAVYSALGGKLRGEVYVVEDDVSRRGLKSRIPPKVHVIGYPDLVQMMESERVVSLL